MADDLYLRYLQDPRNRLPKENALAPGRIETDQGHIQQPTLVPDDLPSVMSSPHRSAIDGILESVIESVHNHGPRGAPTTRADLNIIAQQCRDYLNQIYPALSSSFYHVGGANWEGESNGFPLREWYMPGLSGRKGASLSDLTWLYDPLGAGLDGGSLNLGHINSQSTHLNGRAITRERWSMGNLARTPSIGSEAMASTTWPLSAKGARRKQIRNLQSAHKRPAESCLIHGFVLYCCR